MKTSIPTATVETRIVTAIVIVIVYSVIAIAIVIVGAKNDIKFNNLLDYS